MEKILEIEEGRSYNFKASALSPIQYNRLFRGRDFIRDIETMAEKRQEAEESETGTASLSLENYEQFARLAYLFAWQGLAPTPTETQEQRDFREKYPDPWAWIDSFDTFSFYKLLPEIIDIWYGGDIRLVKAKKAEPTPPEK